MFRNIRTKVYATAVLTLALCGVALAVWYIQGAIEGTSTPTKIGKTTPPTVVPIKVAFAGSTLTPGEKEPLELVIENTSPGATEVTFHNLAATVTSSNEAGCPKSNISITTANGFWQAALNGTQSTATHVPAGVSMNLEGAAAEIKIGLSPTAPVACETALITVHVVAS